MATIQPLYDRVVIKREADKAISAGGIILTGKSTEKPDQGIVIAAGRGKSNEDGTIREMSVQVGDLILFGKFGGVEIELDYEKFVIIKEDDIMGIIK